MQIRLQTFSQNKDRKGRH